MKSIRILACGAAVAVAAASSGRAEGTTTATAAFVSQYFFRGLRYGGPSLQPYVQYDRGNATLGLWASTPLSDRVPGQSDPEIDPYASYKWSVSDKVSVQPGFTWYTYPEADPTRGFHRSTFEPSVALNYTTRYVTFSPKAYYDLVLEGPTFELNALSAIPLGTIGTELDVLATVGTYEWDSAINHASPDVKNWGDYWLLSVSVPYQITRRSRVSLGFAYTEGRGNYLKQGTAPRQPRPLAASRGVVTLTYAITF